MHPAIIHDESYDMVGTLRTTYILQLFTRTTSSREFGIQNPFVCCKKLFDFHTLAVYFVNRHWFQKTISMDNGGGNRNDVVRTTTVLVVHTSIH